MASPSKAAQAISWPILASNIQHLKDADIALSDGAVTGLSGVSALVTVINNLQVGAGGYRRQPRIDAAVYAVLQMQAEGTLTDTIVQSITSVGTYSAGSSTDLLSLAATGAPSTADLAFITGGWTDTFPAFPAGHP